jgi:hypothetical protein
MFKAFAETENGGLLVLGLSFANLERMIAHDPVCFRLTDVIPSQLLGLPEMWMLLAVRPGPSEHPEPAVMLRFTRQQLEEMMLRPERPCEPELPDNWKLRIVMFSASDEDRMAEIVRDLTTPQTRVTRTGFSPSDLPPSEN